MKRSVVFMMVMAFAVVSAQAWAKPAKDKKDVEVSSVKDVASIDCEKIVRDRLASNTRGASAGGAGSSKKADAAAVR